MNNQLKEVKDKCERIKNRYLPSDVIYPKDYHVVIQISDLKWLLETLNKIERFINHE